MKKKQKNTYISRLQQWRKWGEISVALNPVGFPLRQPHNRDVWFTSLAKAPHSLFSLPETTVWRLLKRGVPRVVTWHRMGIGGLFALTTPGTKAMRQEHPMSSCVLVFLFLQVMEILPARSAKSPPLPEGKHHLIWNEVWVKDLWFLLQVAVNMQTVKSYTLKLESQWCKLLFLIMSHNSG